MKPKELLKSLELDNQGRDDLFGALLGEYKRNKQPLPAALGATATKAATKSRKEAVSQPKSTEVLQADLKEQLKTASVGTNIVIEQLNAIRGQLEQLVPVNEVELKAALEAQVKKWDKDGSLEQAAAKLEALGGRMTVVATPNVKASRHEITELYKKFGEDQPYLTYVNEEFLRLYDDDELSGSVTDDAPVRFRLIHSVYDPELYGTAAQQRAALVAQQAAAPSQIVPSALDGLTHMQTLRAGGDKLSDNSAVEKTYIRDFSLPEKRFGGWPSVPYVCVSYDGEPRLGRSRADNGYDGRFALG